MSSQLSVIIPTYNRKHILARTLEAYMRQSARPQILEILVVDDGSTDGTGAIVGEIAARAQVPVRHLFQPNSGLSAARNHGIREALGELILFADDDIIPAPNLVSEHLNWHKRYPDPAVAVLGFVTWSPEVHPTPFMEWLGFDGVQFNFGALTRGEVVDFQNAYSCNTSLKTAWVKENGGFDEDFKGYGFEDTEFGYRMCKKGLRVLYNPDAVGYHYKFVSFADVCNRAQLVAEARKVLDTKAAGKEVAAIESAQVRSKPTIVRVLRKLLRGCLVPAAPLLKPLLDTRFPLPWSIYRFMYHRYAERLGGAASKTSRFT